MTTTVSHIGICVSDVERSLRFYCDGLGFTPSGSHHVGPAFSTLMELEDVDLDSRFIERDGLRLELLRFRTPHPTGDGSRRAMNALGLTHLCIRVDDVDHVAATLESLGGRVVAGTRTTFSPGSDPLDFVYCTDPDGIRIELMRLPTGAPAPGPAP
jgi:catechol 2,3-dioxygenase-like lactoylglutathione lyase family enzyme